MSITLSELKGIIQTALRSSPFSISGVTLASSAITALFIEQFGSDALVLNGAAQQSETATSITVKGTLASPYLGAPNLTVSAEFTVPDTTAEVSASVSGFPSDWTLSMAFPSLKRSLFDSFTFGNPSFTLASRQAPVLPSAFPSRYGLAAYPTALAAELVPGLSFQATATVKAGLTGINQLLGGDSWTLSGPIECAAGLPSIALTSTPGTPITIGGFSVNFSLALVAAMVVPGDTSKPSIVTSVLQFEAEIDKQLTSSRLVIPIYARTFTPSLGALMIQGELSDLSPLTVIDIAALLGEDIHSQIPPDFPALNDIGVRSVSLSIVPATLALLSANIVIEFQPRSGQEWSVFEGLIVFDGMSVSFAWIPAESSLSTSVEATATIAGGTLTAGVSLPDTQFFCTLESGAIDISEIVRKVSDGTISMKAVNCIALDFSGSVQDKWYRFQTTVSDDWAFTLPGSTKSLAITQIGMDLTYTPGAASPLTGQVIGNFDIAGTSLYASAEYGGTDAGWVFAGGTLGKQSIDVNLIVNDVLSLFGAKLPGNAPKVTLTNLNVTFCTASHDFTFMGMASITIAGSVCDLGVHVSHDATGTIFNGYLWIGDDTFELDFAMGTDTVVAGRWTPLDGSSSSLSLNHLIEALNLGLPDLPTSLDLTLTGAAIVYDVTNDVLVLVADMQSGSSLLFVVSGKTATKEIGFAALSKQALNLSDLPLVGQQLAKIETIAIDQLQISVSNTPLAQSGAQFNTLMESYQSFLGDLTYPVFPTLPSGATTRAYLSALFDDGTGKLPLTFALDGGTTTGSGSAALTTGAPMALTTVGGVTGASAPDGVTWFDIQKSFGPVSIQRIGVLYQSSAQALWFEIDASLAFGAMSISLMGLGIAAHLKDFSPEFNLQGMGVSYSEPPLTVAGELVNMNPPGSSGVRFEGGLVIRTGEFTVQVFGYFGENKDGFNSMFLFGDIAFDFGGPPAFFVTGLALGFGYNSKVTLPTIDEVATFPFIQVLPTSAVPNPDLLGGPNASPLEVLNKILDPSLHTPAWVQEEKGSLWLAAGITFTSFELVNSQALLMVDAGSELVIGLVGTSRAQFPQAGGEVLYANIELDLLVRFAPSEGVFSLQALLASSSYLLDKACVLTGGFAFFVWYAVAGRPDSPGSKHEGDFVLTLGGYHPAFTPPPHYPLVPPVGFHWAMDSTITIQGGAYFALTPGALMVGGDLKATYQSGHIKAWFDAHADVIIRWKPFWFDADIGLTIGASYTIDWGFTTSTLSLEVGCELEFWGPPTGGSVTIDLYVISVTIPFGTPKNNTQQIKGWADVAQMLPNTGSSSALNVLTLSPATGLIPNGTAPLKKSAIGGTPDDFASNDTPWIVRGTMFSFNTSSSIPASTATMGTDQFHGDTFDVYPLVQLNSQWKNVRSELVVKVQNLHGQTDYSSCFEAVGVQSSVPAGLWGAPPEDNSGNPQAPDAKQLLVPNQLTGLSVEVKAPKVGASAGSIDVQTNLKLDELALKSAVLPLSSHADPTGDTPANSTVTISTIVEGIASTKVADARNAIFKALRSADYAPDTNDPMTRFRDQIGGALNSEPLLVQ
ncbi:MAG: hypothetical protein JWN14_3873 [Chthonomonadales bacterium]|nr:hypothetical protein [Chthonomonadales bacterium]